VQRAQAAAWPDLVRALAARPAGGHLGDAAVSAAREAYGAFLSALADRAPSASRASEAIRRGDGIER
jgi:hypothetical protein